MATFHLTGRLALAGVVALGGFGVPMAMGQDAKIKDALESVDEDVRVYNEHLMFLASPFLGGRLPGTPGMKIAKDYVEHYFKEAGLRPAFDVERSGQIVHRASYRQPFPLGGTSEVTKSDVSGFIKGKQISMEAGTDFRVTGIGGSGTVAAPVTFVGYGINNNDEGYVGFEDGDSLEGKIAMVLRFEPMDENGKSLWADSGWSPAAGFNRKIQSVMDRNPAAVILVNTPGADDPRVGTLLGANNAGGKIGDVPVIHMSVGAAQRLVEAGDPKGRSLMDLREIADGGRAIVELEGIVTIDAAIERKSLMAENIGGLIPGKGSLANEIIVIGAHMDHLGMGAFGSRGSAEERGTTLHPGADDNASGTAGIILIANWLNQQYAELPDDANARTVLIVAFSGEESGLNGSRYYVNHPIEPLEQHYMMMNFDMIGRILNKRLSVSGTTSADGFGEWLQPFFDESGLEVVTPRGAGGGSDHLPFMQKEIPILFAIIADFHGDYHTPRDVSKKINRVDAVKASRLFDDIAFAAAQRPETLVWANPNANRPQAGGGRGAIKVRVGVMPGNYDGEGGGVLIDAVTAGGPAEAGGLRAGDRIMRWNGKKVAEVNAWMVMLAKHKPGDVVNVGVVRDGNEVTLKVKLEASGG